MNLYALSFDDQFVLCLQVLTQLEALLHEVKINDDTDYCQLYTVVELLDIIVGAENLQFREKVWYVLFYRVYSTASLIPRHSNLDCRIFVEHFNKCYSRTIPHKLFTT